MNDDASQVKQRVESLTATLLAISTARFDTRTPRDFEGDAWDVLAFLVNSTADEVERLVRDLETEREALRRAQSKLVEAEKFAALGRVAAGVAHEMNQPLTVIQTIADMWSEGTTMPDPSSAEDLALLREAARQLATIVSAVRLFGRGGGIRLESIAVFEPIDGALSLMKRRLEEHGVETRLDRPDHPLPSIMGDPDRLRQVFVNLLANAIEALDEARVEQPHIRISVAPDAGDLEIRVTDNGPGVAPEILDRLFEPFCTTKPVGKGTGLGLSVARGIIGEHGGSVEYEPSSSGGAGFRIRLPVPETQQ